MVGASRSDSGIFRLLFIIFESLTVSQNLEKFFNRCVRCGISSAAEGIRLSENGVCTECKVYDEHKDFFDAYFKNYSELQDILEQAKWRSRSEYDCILLYSGGKDSTYVLYKLKELGLKLLAFTFDNGFISRQAIDNINDITAELGVKSVIFTHAEMNEVFKESLQKYSTVCKGCFKAILDLSLSLADDLGIETIVTGLSRGQIAEERLKFFLSCDIVDPALVDKKLKEGRYIYHVTERFKGLDGEKFLDGVATERVQLIDFFRYSDVSKAAIYDFLKMRSLRWTQPSDTGFCSSNCMINDVGVAVHKIEKGYSNYEVPTAWEVRLGHLSRAEALAELVGVSNARRVQQILRHIGYQPRQRILGSETKTGQNFELGTQIVDSQGSLRKESAESNMIPGRNSRKQLKSDGSPDEQKASWPFGEWIHRSFVANRAMNRKIFAQALFQLIVRHRTLQLEFSFGGSGWDQFFSFPTPLPLTFVDLSKYSVDQYAEVTVAMAGRIFTELTGAQRGRIFRMVVFTHADRIGCDLVIFSNSSVSDVLPWSNLIDDLNELYRVLMKQHDSAEEIIGGKCDNEDGDLIVDSLRERIS